jgi:hypothetical protein
MLHLLLQTPVSSPGTNNGAMAAGIAFGLCIGLAIGVAVAALFCYFISRSLEAVPPQYRQQITPGQVWLLIIPFFGIFWNFIVFQRVPDSFRAYFDATGQPLPNEDYGKQMGLTYAILAAVGLLTYFVHIPFLGLANLVGLVLLIILTVKFNRYRAIILTGGAGATGGFPVQPLPPTVAPTDPAVGGAPPVEPL